jgi:hypothetical protein
MMKVTMRLMLATALFLSSSMSQAAPTCRTERIDQETYLALNPLVYAYAPNIDKSLGGWKPFIIQILVGQYRSPLLLKKGFMREGDLNKAVSGDPDVKVYQLKMAGYDPRQGKAQPAAPMKITYGKNQSMTIGVKSVELAKAVSLGSDHVVLDVCS